MCGIAGMIDLTGRRPVAAERLERMAQAILHRGPDEDGFFLAPGVGMASRRLSIVGLADGRQPLTNEDGSVACVYNGELFDYQEKKAALQARGHRFRTHCDTELIPHLWEDHEEQLLTQLRGQFALGVWDRRQDAVLLARDRFGICPLYYARHRDDDGEWLLFASEIKALLASGMIRPRPDLRGIDQVFNFIAVPGPATCFQGIRYLQPGECLRITLGAARRPAQLTRRPYWQIEFPDHGQEDRGQKRALVDELEQVLLGAVERRLRADVPVVSYLSGGIDSSLVVAMAAKIRGTPIPTFTIQIRDPRFDETSQAAVVSRHIGSRPLVVPVGDAEVLRTYADLTYSAEAPVVDTSCIALLLLARAVHRQGYKVALTGEGADEWLAGYPWYKVHHVVKALDALRPLRAGRALRHAVFRAIGSAESVDQIRAVADGLGDHTAFQEFYSLVSLSRQRFFSRQTLDALRGYSPYLELEPRPERVRRWHPLNRALYWGARIHLAGHLLTLKGDRIAMHSSVEMRYPYLDEQTFDTLARIHPRWKLRGLRDKYLLRLVGARYLPRQVAWRPKGMFRAPLDTFFNRQVPRFVEQLLSDESLRRTGYFDPRAVQYWRERARNGWMGPLQRVSVELGLMGVVATQLWHHTFIDDSLAELPPRPAAPASLAAAV